MRGPVLHPDLASTRGHSLFFWKRLFDVIAALVALAALALPMAAVAIAVRAHDGGPVFFRQHRVGRGGRPFEILKFRSMVINANRIGGLTTAAGDPRITRVGRFIRRTSLDELPQLINVLRGEMSIVGPRPDVPAQQALYNAEDWLVRHRVRPGITGLAQAVLRSNATADERTRLDLQYVASASLRLDFKIILMTARQILANSSN